MCSGTGRHSIELEARGVDTVGFELNPSYVELARHRAEAVGVSPVFEIGDVRSVAFGGDFDAAILMWNSFGFFSDDENLALLARIRSALKSGGRFLLELLNRDFLTRHFEATSDSEVDGIRVTEEREFDILSSRMRSSIVRHDSPPIERRTNWRIYSPHEVADMGRRTGFDLEAAYADLDGSPVHLDARLIRYVFVARQR